MNYPILSIETLKDIRDAKLRLHEKCLKRNPKYNGSLLNDLDVINGCIKLKESKNV